MDFPAGDNGRDYQKTGRGPMGVKYFNQTKGGWIPNDIYYVVDSDDIEEVVYPYISGLHLQETCTNSRSSQPRSRWLVLLMTLKQPVLLLTLKQNEYTYAYKGEKWIFRYCVHFVNQQFQGKLLLKVKMKLNLFAGTILLLAVMATANLNRQRDCFYCCNFK